MVAVAHGARNLVGQDLFLMELGAAINVACIAVPVFRIRSLVVRRYSFALVFKNACVTPRWTSISAAALSNSDESPTP